MTHELIQSDREKLAQIVREIALEGLPRWLREIEATAQREAAPLPPRMTYEQFLAWANEDTLAEWVDGEVMMTTPASYQHQELAGFLYRTLGAYVEAHSLGVVLMAPFQMKMEQGREPDLLFVTNAHRARLREAFLDGPAGLVVEVISPESLARDRGAKFREYEVGGVPEYWLIDPLRRWADFYVLGEEGVYQTVFSQRIGVYRSQSVAGFWLQVEWLWQSPLPNGLEILRALGVI